MVLLIFGPAGAFAQPWAGVVDPSRAINWASAGVKGDLPDANWTQCGSTISAYSGSATTINTAISKCGTNQYVSLGVGTFTLSSGINFGSKSNVVLRGAGADTTMLVFTGADNCSGLGAHICVWNQEGNYTQSPGNTASWTSGFAKGTTSITLSSTANLQVGQTLILDQCDDGFTGTSCSAGSAGGAGSASDPKTIYVCQVAACDTEGNSSGSGRSNRAQQQLVTVTGIIGSTVSFTPSLYMPNWRSSQSPGAWWGSSLPLSGIGIENLSIDGSNNANTGILFYNVTNSWVTGIRSVKADGSHVEMYQSTHLTVRSNYFFQTYNAASKSYGVESFESSDDLVENNIFEQVVSPFVADGSASGVVFSYNFAVNDAFSTPTWMMGEAWLHSAGIDNTLFEGNIGPGMTSDSIHGSHHFTTNFRNYFSGWDPGRTQQTTPEQIYTISRYMNIVGNVLGKSGYHSVYECAATGSSDSCPSNGDLSIYNLGYSGNEASNASGVNNDPLVKQTMLRWGNYDTVNAAVRFVTSEVPSGLSQYANPVPASQSLPASFYSSTQPSWWPSGKVWPPIGPDVTGGNITGVGGHANTIPAEDCYTNALSGPTDGTGSVLSFNANKCYTQSSGGGGGVTTVAPPTNLTLTTH
jgi:hypothetical protein